MTRHSTLGPVVGLELPTWTSAHRQELHPAHQSPPNASNSNAAAINAFV